mmetsp:Transcript_16447/g.24261  ORF Transcript_16447/g.24261 Transcript_16447/m.24261 type:complete len:457 (+) Transcript_16447:2962-4332(+)
MSSQEEALTILRGSTGTWGFMSTQFQEAASKLMTCQEAEDGHIFLKEGEDVTEMHILENGILERYKSGPAEKPVLIDTIEGKGNVTGFFHSFQGKSDPAFATVVAKGPVRVWTVRSTDVRDLLTSNSSFAMEALARMAFRLRQETKISRALVNRFGSSVEPTNKDAIDTMRVLCYDSTNWVRNGFKPAIEAFNESLKKEGKKIVMEFMEDRLSSKTAVFAAGHKAICTFVNDKADADTIKTLSVVGVKMIAQRAAGFDRIDMNAALTFGLTVARVPAYSPYAVAEMGISLLMAVNRKIATAHNRVKMSNFSLDEGLLGMDIHGKTVGVMGTGKIGAILCNIIVGFGVKLICYDVFENEGVKAAGGMYVSKEEIYAQSDVIFLMMPLLPPTRHTINLEMLPKLKKGVILINTSRGGLVDTKALLEGLRTGQISGVGMDVYENEEEYFFSRLVRSSNS